MNGADIVIVGLGMMTPVGLSAAETSASVRAATMRMTEITWQDDHFQPFVIGAVPEDGLPELAEACAQDVALTQREARMLRLGMMPLIEALATLPRDVERPGLILALPELETMLPLDGTAFLRRFAVQTAGAFDLRKSRAPCRGRAGGLAAIGTASQLLAARQTTFLLAGGIDTYRDPYILGTLNAQGRVKTPTNLDGFVPGEGAAFLLLTTPAAAAAARLAPIASLSRVSAGFETGHLYSTEVYRGEGLAQAIEKFFTESGLADPVQEVYSSMNGENHWAKEWGVSYLRNMDKFHPQMRMHHPADCCGDLGAASGPMMAGLAALGILQNFRRSPALIYCSSDRGERAALAVIGKRR